MEKNKENIKREVFNEIQKYNEAVKNNTATEGLDSILTKLNEKLDIKITDDMIEAKAKEINGESKSSDFDSLLNHINNRIEELNKED